MMGVTWDSKRCLTREVKRYTPASVGVKAPFICLYPMCPLKLKFRLLLMLRKCDGDGDNEGDGDGDGNDGDGDG